MKKNNNQCWQSTCKTYYGQTKPRHKRLPPRLTGLYQAVIVLEYHGICRL